MLAQRAEAGWSGWLILKGCGFKPRRPPSPIPVDFLQQDAPEHTEREPSFTFEARPKRETQSLCFNGGQEQGSVLLHRKGRSVVLCLCAC